MEALDERFSSQFCAKYSQWQKWTRIAGKQVAIITCNFVYNRSYFFSYWNPHAYVYKLLTDKYNKIDHDLVDLVNYLINTDRTMQCIYYFSSPGLRSLKTYSLLTDNEERNIPIEIKVRTQ